MRFMSGGERYAKLKRKELTRKTKGMRTVLRLERGERLSVRERKC